MVGDGPMSEERAAAPDRLMFPDPLSSSPFNRPLLRSTVFKTTTPGRWVS